MAITGQYGKGQYGESTVGPEKPQEERNPDLITRMKAGAKNLKDKAIIKGKDFKNALDNSKVAGEKPKEYVDPYNQKQDVTYRTPNAPDTNEQNMTNSVGQTEDLIQRGATEGEKANKTLQNVEIPRSKLVSFGDIIKSDEFKGQRVPYMANAIGTTLANALSGLSGREYDSYLKQQNQAMSDTYAQNKAARDTAATQANIQDIEAGNKAEMGKYVQQSDAITEQALKRYGLLEDQETKKQVLGELIEQATGKTGNAAQWNSLNADEKFAVMALQQVYNGDYSVASMFLEKYGDDFARIIDGLFEKLGITRTGNGTEPTGNGGGNVNPTPNTDAYGNEITSDGKTKYAQLMIPGNEEPTLVPLYPATTTNGDAEQQKVADYILSLPNVTNQQKIALAQSYDSQIPKLAQIPGQSVEKKVQGKINKDNKFAEKIESLAKGKTSEQVYDALIGMASDGSALADPDVVRQYEDAVALYGQKTVQDKVNSILSQDMETKDKIAEIGKLAETGKYKNLIAQNPELQKFMENTNTDLMNRYTYIDPYNKKASGRFYNALNGTTGGNKFIIKDDGTIEIIGGKKPKILNPYSAVGISNANTNPDVFLSTLLNNITMDSVRSQIDPSMTDEEIIPIFKNSPMYKMLEGIANTKDIKLINNKYWNDVVAAYDKWNSY